VLDVLAKHAILSSFFVIGDKLRDGGRRSLCQRARSEGHWIGNHTFNHLVPLGLSRHEGDSSYEIGRTEELLGELAHERKFFRPFGGQGHINTALLDQEAVTCLQEGKFTCVLWNAVPRDWELPNTWVEIAIAQCRAVVRPLLVIHDISTGAMAHLERFIVTARDSGMTFVQDFPEDCVPMERGEVVRDMAPYVSAPRKPEEDQGFN